MARLLRFSSIGVPLFFLVLVFGCANTGQNSSIGLPVAQGPTPSQGSGASVVRAQQPKPAPVKYGKLPAPSVSQPSEESSRNLAVAEKYQIRICAWVNGKPIFKNDVMNEALIALHNTGKLPEPTRSQRRKEILEKQLKAMIDRELIYQDAYGKLKQSPQFMKQLKEAANKQFDRWVRAQQKRAGGVSRAKLNHDLQLAGSSLETIRSREEQNFFVGEYIRSRVKPLLDQISPRDIRKYYENHKNEFQTLDRLEWEDLFVATGKYPSREKALEMAQYLAGRLLAGDPIEKLLKYDDGLSKTTNGKGIGQRRGEIVPNELEPYLFKLKPGEVGPIYEIATGFHVYRVTEREYAGEKEYSEEVQKKIHHKLRNAIGQREQQRIVRDLAAHAVIEVDLEMLK